MNQLRINNLNIVASWSFNSNAVSNKTCPLCRNNLMAPTQTEIDRKNIKNIIVVGKCKHAYHESCMSKWLSDSNVSCVTCKTEWKPIKNSISTAVIKLKESNVPNVDTNDNVKKTDIKKIVNSDSDSDSELDAEPQVVIKKKVPSYKGFDDFEID